VSQNEVEQHARNPKQHDNVFKWAIATFAESFFSYFAAGVSIKKIEIIDKEFIKKYGAPKESLKSDIFLVVEVEIDGQPWEIVILIELKSKREDVDKKMLEYMCYASLLRKLPVWGIAF